MAKVLENVLRGIICSFEVNNWSNLWRYWNQIFALFPAAIFVLLGGAQIWRSHSELYKFLLHILKNNSVAENCTDVRLLIYRYSIISGILSFRHSTVLILLSFWWRDSENHQNNNFFFLTAFCYFVVCPESLSLTFRKIMFRKIAYPTKYPEIEKNRQKNTGRYLKKTV